MSRRYPEQRECPQCGLTVQFSDTLGYRQHAGRAFEVDPKSPCAAGTKQAEEWEADQHQRASADRRREFWEGRDPESDLPRHLR